MSAGLLKQQTDAKSHVTTMTYDKLSRVTQARVHQTVVVPPEVALPDVVSTFTWDTATKGIGQLAMMETADGNRRTHTYTKHRTSTPRKTGTTQGQHRTPTR